MRSRPAAEVILSHGGGELAGVVLLRSGIEAHAQLAEHGIEVVAASPQVGENLQDHLMVALVMSCPQPVTLAAAETPRQLVRYLTRRKGLLTSNVGEAAAFIETRPGLEAPDIELLFGPVPYIDHGQVGTSPDTASPRVPSSCSPRAGAPSAWPPPTRPPRPASTPPTSRPPVTSRR